MGQPDLGVDGLAGLPQADLVALLLAEREARRVDREQIATLIARVAELTLQVADLLARLGTDSTNSSMPPSTDGPGAKPRQRSLRGASGRKPGGQAGHRGNTLAMVDNPDRVVGHRPDQCGGCGQRLSGRLPSAGVERRQVFDLPQGLSLEVTEHVLHAVKCPGCATVTKAGAPAGVGRQVQYGPHAAAFCVYLVAGQHVALGRAAKLVSDLFGQPISPATITKMVADAAGVVVAGFKPVAAQLLLDGGHAHVDETGFKVAGKTRWVHSMSNPRATWIEAHDKRGRQALDDIGILPKYGGILVHDAWKPYDGLERVAAHQLCCAHVLRELNAIIDWHRHTHDQWCWAKQVRDAITAIIHDPTTAATQRDYLTTALDLAERLDPDPAGRLGARTKALRNRIATRLDDYLRFATTPGLPPTNNPAEQEIRMVKIKQKISGCLRTIAGASHFTAIRSYLATARKNQTNPLAALSSLYTPEIWLPATP